VEDLGSLTSFVCAADTRSFTLAGRQLGLSSSAVGKSVSRLEARLGVRLFHRSTRTLTLTAEGGLFLERCRRILSEFEAAELELAQSRAAPRGKLRVSLPIVNTFTVPVLCRFMHAYPEVQLDLEFGDQLVDVIDEGFDAVIRAGEISDSRLMSRVLGEFHLMLVASPGYLDRAGRPQTPEDLSRHACLAPRFQTSRKFERWPLRRDQQDLDIELAPTAIANTIEPLLQMAEQGHGIACLPDFLVRDQLGAGTLETVLDEFVAHTGVMRILWPSSRYISPKLRVFIDFIAEQLFPAELRRQ